MTELLAFPRFAFGVFLGLTKTILSEVEVFLIAVLGVLLAIKIDVLTGVISALGLYMFFRMGSLWAGLLGKEIHLLSSVISRRNIK